ncbi:TetR/AcrR family transcriptional regulator [Nocardia inohanensis]|uniref:TetR/AcrR family transcriptional regulator n=1 Tax=Nocardia inohanensis TaxID=209246 RepID=UPI0008306812|nr:TetR/AcrR family transcriptional regulator [Nocardia inohanensis]
MTDGDQVRTRRRRNPEQTRKAIIGGLLAAVHDGDFDPTTKTIAARAGVSERSIFVHFPTRNDLLVAAVDLQSQDVEAAIAEVDPALPLDARIEAVVRQSERIFALQREPRLVGLLESQTVPAVDERMRLTDGRIRDGLARAFAPELTRAAARDEQLLDLVDATAGWAYRHHLMDRRGATAAAASAAIGRALRVLLGAA